VKNKAFAERTRDGREVLGVAVRTYPFGSTPLLPPQTHAGGANGPLPHETSGPQGKSRPPGVDTVCPPSGAPALRAFRRRSMLKMAMARTSIDLDALVSRVDDLVRTHGAVPRGELRTIKRHLPAIAPRLVARGLEVGSSVRRPLEAQLLDLAKGGFLPRKGLERRVAGASAREVKEAAERLVRRGALVDVVRESGPGLVAPSGDVLDAMDLAELLRCLSKVEKLVRRARPARGMRPTVLRGDVSAPLARWIVPASDSAPAPQAESLRQAESSPLVEALAREIRKRSRETSLPIRVPELLRATGTPVEEGKRALIDGAARGLFELEPESGMGRLSGEDAELCPPGPMGTRLSWVVVRDAKGNH
jgi:hypothetical protein